MLGAVGAAAGVLGGCSTRAREPAASEQTAAPGLVDVTLEPAETEIDLGGVTVRTWAYGGGQTDPHPPRGNVAGAGYQQAAGGDHRSLAWAGDTQCDGRRARRDATADRFGSAIPVRVRRNPMPERIGFIRMSARSWIAGCMAR